MNISEQKKSIISEIGSLSKNIVQEVGKSNGELGKSIKNEIESIKSINPYPIFNKNIQKLVSSIQDLVVGNEKLIENRNDIIDERKELFRQYEEQEDRHEESIGEIISEIKNLKNIIPLTPAIPRSSSEPYSTEPISGLGDQRTMPGENLGSATRTLESGRVKGYIIVPGHLTGGGAPGEAETVQRLAKRLYDRVKVEAPNVPVVLNMNDWGGDWEKQKAWVQSKENEGWEVIEIHMDIASGGSRGIIPSRKGTSELASLYAPTYGSFGKDWKGGLALPNRGADLIEMGAQTPIVTQEVNQKNNVNAIDKLVDPVVKIFKLMSERIR